MSDQSSSEETLYLLRSPANVKRLLATVERAKAGTVQTQTVDELCNRFELKEDDTTHDLKNLGTSHDDIK